MERRVSVQGPITPCGASEAILIEHADNRHNGQATVGKLGAQLLLASLRVGHWASAVRHTKNTASGEVTRSAAFLRREEAQLTGSAEDDPLRDARRWNLADSGEAVRDVLEGQAFAGGQVA